jgi:hypothetical protein
MRIAAYITFMILMMMTFIATNRPPYGPDMRFAQGSAMVGFGVAFFGLIASLTDGWSGVIDIVARSLAFGIGSFIVAAGLYTGLWYDPETFKHKPFGTVVQPQKEPKP